MLENRLLEIIIIALVVMVLFGAKRLPDSARSLGKSLRILKAEARAGREEATQEASSTTTDPPVLTKAEVSAQPRNVVAEVTGKEREALYD
ncbi:Sec-independent protein translocase subunit TatA [Streptomyces sp. NPDC052101]|uniref:Sec-independent protein translocase subunit TatA n=1 Tax=Streptomyces sp. NPDC052101 TaxID=3155763 RepID=UPI00343D668C